MKTIFNFERFLNEYLNESIINQRSGNDIWYHGSSSTELKIENIKINRESNQMFYGDAFYVSSDITLAKKYGKYIYEVIFDGNFFEVKDRQSLGTYGIFEQYLESIRDSYVENILDYIQESPEYWKKKLKISKKLLQELYNEEDSYTLTDYFIQNNINDLFQEYIDNQISLREEYEEMGYEGLIDITQAAIFNPQKSIQSLKLI